MKTLICTVGGSPEPVVAAIREHHPDQIVFVCSEDDVSTRKRGSHKEVEGIQSAAGVSASACEVVRVPADDPSAIIKAVDELVTRAMHAGECIGDYTGGTKSMSAALFFVVSQTPGAHLSLVSGPRPNLLKVEAGARVVNLASAAVHRRRLSEHVAMCWQRFSYAEAQRLISLAGLEVRDAHTDRWEQLSHGYALWDAWDHGGALKVLDPFGRYASDYLPALRMLARRGDDVRSDAERVVDIYLSAERRAHAHQFDAAVLRLYRALEWIAQWTLRWHSQIDTSDVPADSPVAQHATPDSAGNLVVSCFRAWRCVAELHGPLKAVAIALEEDSYVLELANRRNTSVLAHGVRALGEQDYRAARAAIDKHLWPAFNAAAGSVVGRQLPTALPADDAR